MKAMMLTGLRAMEMREVPEPAMTAANHVLLKLADRINRHYQRRLRKMVKCLRASGFAARLPGGTFYLYVPAPCGAGAADFATAEDASQFLIREHLISTVPWDDAGAFLRFSATFESAGDKDDDRVVAELGARLAKAQLRF